MAGVGPSSDILPQYVVGCPIGKIWWVGFTLPVLPSKFLLGEGVLQQGFAWGGGTPKIWHLLWGTLNI